MNNELKPLREFGRCRLDLEKKFLWHDDKPVRLPLKAIELLCILVENGGAVVTKDEIWKSVWQNSFVEETNLTHYIYLLRKTFKDLGETDLIQTVPRRGYRFARVVREIETGDIIIERQTLTRTLIEEISPAENRELEQENQKAVRENIKTGINEEEKRNTRFWGSRKTIYASLIILFLVFAGGFIGWHYHNSKAETSLAEVESIAVLPLQNLSENENEKTLSLGLTDAMISKLGGLNHFAVRPLSATQKYTAEQIDALRFGEQLKVDAILEGSLQTANNRLRVNVRLLRVADGAQIWAGSFDENETDILKLQDLLSAQIAESLGERLTPQERQQLSARSTENLEAYKLYLKGRYFWNQRSIESYFKAIQLFEQSVELDPNFALGYSGIADCYTLLEQREGLLPEEAFPAAERAARKALELNEALAEAHASMALIKNLYRWDWNESEAHYRRAIELNPNYATTYGSYGMLLISEKRFDDAEKTLKKAESLDPTSRSIAIYLAWKFYFARQFDHAIEQSKKALELDPSLTTPYLILGAVYEQKGMFNESVEAELKRLKRHDPQMIESLKEAYRKSGIRGFWQKQIEVIRDKPDRKINVADYQIATRYALLNQDEETLREIEKGFASRGSMWHLIKVDPAFDALRGNPRFQDLLRILNLPN
ncbi:MAG: winged helix-turn-helix domain-containing protein [Acidobacteriota bacterium]|nr:winged helix-turn-helix domain-containing protein [Acidobacteriota bacterium]